MQQEGEAVSFQEGLLSVGPKSVGSAPGPACYGRGGSASLTDAEVVLGRVVHFPHICGTAYDLPLDVGAAEKALKQLVLSSRAQRHSFAVSGCGHRENGRLYFEACS